VTFTLTLRNPGPALNAASAENTLPAGWSYAGGLSASSGSPTASGSSIHWTGSVMTAQPVTIQWQALAGGGSGSQSVVNLFSLDNGQGMLIHRALVIIINGIKTYLPALRQR
jgi:hypothetical protein